MSAGLSWVCGPLGMSRLCTLTDRTREMKDNAAVAKNHRLRAEQLRNIAKEMTQEKERNMLLGLAEDYEQLADDAENGRGIRRLISN